GSVGWSLIRIWKSKWTAYPFILRKPVSIYLGNQKMIHIGDNKGVQITGLNYTARGQHMTQVRNVID
ncbi:C40 family peptidase, partial [Bacillus thuringiensis]|nr:C40 family peptidase [Bacillus thuringiensis]